MFRQSHYLTLVVVLGVVSSAAGQVIGFWEFNERSPGNFASTSSGAIIDSSGNNRHLTAQGSLDVPFYVDGCPGYDSGSALNFLDPEDDELFYPDGGASDFDFGATDSFTIEAVVGTLSQPDVGAIAAKDGASASEAQWWFRHENGALKFLISDGPNVSSVNNSGDELNRINNGAWHHVAAVRDAANKTLKLYVDYRLVATAADTTTGTIGNDSNMTIAGFSNSVTNSRQFGPGDIDFVKITGAALEPVQFEQTMAENKDVLALWDFEEGSVGLPATGTPGEILDASGNGRNADALADPNTGLGYPIYVAGQCATKALQFTAGADAVQYPYSGSYPFDIAANSGMTFEMVVRTSATAVYQAFFARDSGSGPQYWARIKDDGTDQFQMSDGTGNGINSTEVVIEDGEWHHLAFIRDGRLEQLRLYVDYQLVGVQGEPTAGLVANTVPLTIAEFTTSSARSFIGEIDTVRISNGALSVGEFLQPPVIPSADLDGDCDVDDADFALFQMQFTGPLAP